LLHLPNIIFSPHISGIDTKGMADMAELAARCIVRLSKEIGRRDASSTTS
jgi:D-3-phosphoglycerate dehydrogenase/(S)-sulfolactate dehydrogenase